MLRFNYDTLLNLWQFFKTVVVEFVLSILFLTLGAALLPLIYHFLTTADTWLVVVFIVVGCEVLALFMAWIYNQ